MLILSGSPITSDRNDLGTVVRHGFPALFREEWRTRYRAEIARLNRTTDREIERAECQPCEGRGYFDSRHPGYSGHTTCSWCNGTRLARKGGARG